MGGVLEQIATRGETRTPDFRLTALDGGSLPLTTTYEALVDGTKGDVDLKRVDIMLGSSPLQARGVIEGTRGLKGKRVVLNIKSKAVNLAELLRLTSKAQPPMASGIVALDAAFDLPQGEADVLERLALEGSFTRQPAAVCRRRRAGQDRHAEPPRPGPAHQMSRSTTWPRT